MLNSREHLVAERDAAWHTIRRMREAWKALCERLAEEALLDEGSIFDAKLDKLPLEFEQIMPTLLEMKTAMEPDFGKYTMMDQLKFNSLVQDWKADHPGSGGIPAELVTEVMEGLAARQTYDDAKTPPPALT